MEVPSDAYWDAERYRFIDLVIGAAFGLTVIPAGLLAGEFGLSETLGIMLLCSLLFIGRNILSAIRWGVVGSRTGSLLILQYCSVFSAISAVITGISAALVFGIVGFQLVSVVGMVLFNLSMLIFLLTTSVLRVA